MDSKIDTEVAIYNIATNPCGIGGTESFSRILNRVFPDSITISYNLPKKKFFNAECALITLAPLKKIIQFLTLKKLPQFWLYPFPKIENKIIIINAPMDLDRVPRTTLKKNKVIYLVHSKPEHVWEHKNYFGRNRASRIKAMALVDLVITLSDEYIPSIMEYLKLPRSLFKTVLHTVELEPRVTAKTFQKSIITICRLNNKSKRLDRFVEVAKRLPEFQFEIYGLGEDEEMVRALVEKVSNVSFMGPTNDIVTTHAKAGIFLMTSDYEGLSIAVLEAISQATPVVIAKNCFGMARMIIQDGVSGFVLEEYSVDETVAHIKTIANSYVSFSEGAIASFVPFNVESFKKQWTDIFSSL